MNTENKNVDFTIIAESPNIAAEVWMKWAQQVPKTVLRPPAFPAVMVFFVAIAISGLGKMIKKILIRTNK